jgi:hypothetical protein
MGLRKRKVTEAMVSANRANALKSTGPVTGRAGSHGWRFPNRGLYPSKEPTVRRTLTVATRSV